MNWEIKQGEDIVKVNLEMVIDALQAAVSCMTKELEENKVLHDDPYVRRKYDEKIKIVQLVKAKFETPVPSRIPGKRRVK